MSKAPNKTQTTTSRIWTQVDNSIFYGDDRYAKSTSPDVMTNEIG